MFGGHEKVARLWRMVGGLFGNIISSRAIFVVPVAAERFSEDGVEWFLDSATRISPLYQKKKLLIRDVRRLDMPTTQIELDHSNKSL